jgi:hypothetical protein
MLKYTENTILTASYFAGHMASCHLPFCIRIVILMWVGCILLCGDKWVKVFPSTQLVQVALMEKL